MPPKKKTHEVTLALEAGNAAMVDLGKMLGPTGANMRAVKLEYDEATSKCKTHSSWCLLNLVISAYQAGPDAVLQNAKSKKLPNPDYVDSVRSLMSSCFCDKY